MFRIVSVFIKCVFSFILVAPLVLHAEWQHAEHVAMTTPIKLMFWIDDDQTKQQGKKISDAVFASFDQIEQQMSRYRDESELSLVNQTAYINPVKISSSLFSVIQESMRFSDLTQGAFDITFASIGYLYDYRKKIKPSEQEITQGLLAVNYRAVYLDHDALSVKFEKPGIMLDLGGIAKGYAVDKGIEILMQHGVKHAYLSAGGDMRLLGDKRGAPWTIAIRHPRDESKQVAILPLSETAISTSGDYERFFIDEQGERIHHILSPSTGKSVKGMMSVTILADRAINSDALSTSVFVMGVEKGLKLINSLQGVDAILIDDAGKIFYSQSLMQVQAKNP